MPVSKRCSEGLFGYDYKAILIVAGLVALCYFGWEYIEALIIILPLPDPIDVKNSFIGFCEKITGLFKKGVSIPKLPGKDHGDEMQGYTGNFDGAPAGLAEDDDDDEEEVGTKRA